MPQLKMRKGKKRNWDVKKVRRRRGISRFWISDFGFKKAIDESIKYVT